MELEQNSSSSPSQSESSAPIESTAPESTPSVTDDGGAAPEAAAPEVPAYTPNYKFKAAGKEYEIDDEYRGYIKSPEDEKRLKRLFEQKNAFEHVHGEKVKTAAERDQYYQELEQFNAGLTKIKDLRSKGEVRKALELLGLNKEEIYKAAKQFLDFEDLPKSAQDVYYQNQEAERQAQTLAAQNQSYQAEMMRMATSYRKSELSQALASPEIQSIAKQFDALHGEGSFEAEVIQTGKAYHAFQQKDLNGFEAADMVAKKYRPFFSQNQAPAAQQAPHAPQAPREVPVIPSVRGASTVAGQKRIKSLKDMKAYAATLED